MIDRDSRYRKTDTLRVGEGSRSRYSMSRVSELDAIDYERLGAKLAEKTK